MRLAIVGGGFTGLAAAVDLVEGGHQVTIFEANTSPGGLAGSFKAPHWSWPLENFYHHIFENDQAIIRLAQKVNHPAFFQTPQTNTFREGLNAPLDTPWALLTHPQFSLWSKFRLSLGLLQLKLKNPDQGKALEKYTVVQYLPKLVGQEAYDKLWQPLLSAKFGPFLPEVNAAWFWARIVKRTKALGYFEGGFAGLLQAVTAYVQTHGGTIHLNTPVQTIKKRGRQYLVNQQNFDRVLITTPAPNAHQLLGQDFSQDLNYLWGQTLILELQQSLMSAYWLNILEDWPFLVAVEHTNFIAARHYGGHPLVYLGNYLHEGDPRLNLSPKKLLDLYEPYLKQINPKFQKKWVRQSWKFQTPYAQPVFPINYSHRLPSIQSQTGIFIANMSMVYPWDRGTNFAIQLGQTAAKLMSQHD